MKRAFLVLGFVILAAAVLTLASAEKGFAGKADRTDSRAFDVEKACTADEISVKEASAEGTGDTCEQAKADCRAQLARAVATKAGNECMLYTKLGTEFELCHAHRGNFNPTDNIEYEPEDCEDGFVRCKIKKSVQYTCN